MQLFNKTFFKFTFGFIGLVLLSFAIVVLAGQLQERNSLGQPASIPDVVGE